MFYGYGILNNHVPTLKATVMSRSKFITSLLAVYKGESNANDSLGTYNGTALGGLTYSGGKSGNAFTFNGTSGVVSFGYNTFSALNTDFSINLWVNLASLDTRQVFFSNYTYTGNPVDYNGFRFMYGSVLTPSNNGGVRVDISDGSNNVTLLSNNYLLSDTWYMITLTRKANTATKIYINGTLSVQNTSAINPLLNQCYPAIGAAGYATSSYDWYMSNGSKIDELNIWTKELTSTEVTTLYNSGTGKFYPTY